MGSKGWDHTKDIPDLTGKVALVTGGRYVRRSFTTAFLSEASHGPELRLIAGNYDAAAG